MSAPFWLTASIGPERARALLDKHTAAIRSLEALAFAGVRCLHGALLVDECNECEPALNHDPGFDEDFNDERRHEL